MIIIYKSPIGKCSLCGKSFPYSELLDSDDGGFKCSECATWLCGGCGKELRNDLYYGEEFYKDVPEEVAYDDGFVVYCKKCYSEIRKKEKAREEAERLKLRDELEKADKILRQRKNLLHR